MFRLMSPERALIWSILAGYLLLPPVASIDLPAIPPMDKVAIPSLSALAAYVLILRRKISLVPQSKLATILMACLVFAPMAAFLTNTEPVFLGQASLPAVTLYDAIASIVAHLIMMIPFLLGMQLLRTEQAFRELAFALLLAGLFYSIPMLLEVRLSPQINTWVYGFFQHAFDQMMRYGGFRPIVFLEHALWVAFFAVTTVMAAVTITRLEPSQYRARYAFCLIYLIVVIVLCKSLGALLYTVTMVPLLLFASTRMQRMIAIVLVCIAVLYPVMRGTGLFPIDTILNYSDQLDPLRGASLRFRVTNEELLLARANEKPFFGWGGWGRAMIFNETGKMTSTVDGHWIIVFGSLGWTGYLGTFGLLAYVVALAARRSSRSDQKDQGYVGLILLVVAINMVDLLPNATITPLTWLFAGALLGYSETVPRADPVPLARRARMQRIG